MEFNEIISRVRKAQITYATYSQADVDQIFEKVCLAVNNKRFELSQSYLQETKLGVFEDLAVNIHYVSKNVYKFYKNEKTCGTFYHNALTGIDKTYSPIGVVGAFVPLVNSIPLIIFEILMALKTRNGIIIAPHPKAYQTSVVLLKIISDAAELAGAPHGIIGWLEKDDVTAKSEALKEGVNYLIASGDFEVTNAVSQSGKSHFISSQANTVSFIHPSADISKAVSSIVESKLFNNGLLETAENIVIVLKEDYSRLITEIQNQECHVISRKDDLEKISKKLFVNLKNKTTNPQITGQTPQVIGDIVGLKVNAAVKVLFVSADYKNDKSLFSYPRFAPIITIYQANTIDEAFNIQQEILKNSNGHTASLFINEITETDVINQFNESINASRLLINTPAGIGTVGSIYNFQLQPSVLYGCGSWSNQLTTENFQPKHLLNIKQTVKRREGMLSLQTPTQLYFKLGSISRALTDLQHRGINKVMVVTDSTVAHEKREALKTALNEANIIYHTYAPHDAFSVPVTIDTGVSQALLFKPEAILGFGTIDTINLAKVIGFQYNVASGSEHDVTKQHILVICVATNLGSRNEFGDNAFKMVNDQRHYIKHASLIPYAVVVDSQFSQDLNKQAYVVQAMEALANAIEAHVSLKANEYTQPNSLEAIRKLFKWLPQAFVNNKLNLQAHDQILNAVALSNSVVHNANVGLAHSLKKALQTEFACPTGIGLRIFLPYVIAYNTATGQRSKTNYKFHDKPNTLVDAYAEIATAINLKGTTANDKVKNLINAFIQLGNKLEVASSLKAYGLLENEYQSKITIMSERALAFKSSNTNPRSPVLVDLQKILLAAYTNDDYEKIKLPVKFESVKIVEKVPTIHLLNEPLTKPEKTKISDKETKVAIKKPKQNLKKIKQVKTLKTKSSNFAETFASELESINHGQDKFENLSNKPKVIALPKPVEAKQISLSQISPAVTTSKKIVTPVIKKVIAPEKKPIVSTPKQKLNKFDAPRIKQGKFDAPILHSDNNRKNIYKNNNKNNLLRSKLIKKW
ncbi:aldehyde dehydrogenase family protein [[Mycoplasma] testudinis]|uniref:aldehyde dehydrogenase family protein n=1 Tax=[Mycoplasma] testudinis TaxID=33924 RepID=UPI00047F182D|nr:iron-containing alcohol dehydrogenase [[Mycoplasma] testudinis]